MAMGIKCSLLGHDFGETTVERDREEQGNEVVSTIREIETCARCGETRVVSENTEVTTIKTPDDVGEEATDEATADTESDAEIVDAEEGEPVDDVDTTTAEPSKDATEFESAAEDDGVILEDDADEELDRDPGEWPESEPDEQAQADAGAPTQTVSHAEENEPDTPGNESDHPADGMAEEAASVADDQAEVWSGSDPDLEQAESDIERTDAESGTVTDGEFRCRECGFTTPIESSSLREGDYCPECHQGMLAIEAA
ncbi:Zn-finger domains containing protein [Halorhabdus sp. SVX81]|nr:Zn-finger domains containing protein [Halorhabdus sp. SVX81]